MQVHQDETTYCSGIIKHCKKKWKIQSDQNMNISPKMIEYHKFTMTCKNGEVSQDLDGW